MSGAMDMNREAKRDLEKELVSISRELKQEEIRKLKFILKDLLPECQLSDDIRGFEVFRSLIKKTLITENDHSLMTECLCLIQRKDLADRYFPNVSSNVRTGKITKFRLQLFKIGNDLTSKNLQQLKDVFEDIPKSKSETITTAYDLFTHLENTTTIRKDDTSELQSALRRVNRNDLADKMLRFHGGVPCAGTAIQATGSDSMASSSSFGNFQASSFKDLRLKSDHALLLAKASLSVGKIGGGTGFRVGSKYIMTASHVIKMALGFEEVEPVSKEKLQDALDRKGLTINFKFASPHLGDHKPISIPLLKIVFYRDRQSDNPDYNLDVTIAELVPVDDKVPVPEPILNFYDNYGCSLNENFYLLGHDRGCEDQEIGHCTTIIDVQDFKKIFSVLQNRIPQDSLVCFQKFVNNEQRIQFQGVFKWGGSGSPGVVIRDGQIRLFTMLTHGYYEEYDVPEDLKIQEGVRLWHIKDILKTENVILCEDIFRGWDNLDDSYQMS